MKAETVILALFSKIRFTFLEGVNSNQILQMTFLNLTWYKQHGFKYSASSLCHLKGNLLYLLQLTINTFFFMAVSIFYKIKSLMMLISLRIKNGPRSTSSTILPKESEWALHFVEEGSSCLEDKGLPKNHQLSLTTYMNCSSTNLTWNLLSRKFCVRATSHRKEQHMVWLEYLQGTSWFMVEKGPCSRKMIILKVAYSMTYGFMILKKCNGLKFKLLVDL